MMDSTQMAKIERFVVLMYNKDCGLGKVNDARHHLFACGKRTLENLPPTQAALYQHVKRVLLQTSFFGHNQ